jgi:hypothetical protein
VPALAGPYAAQPRFYIRHGIIIDTEVPRPVRQEMQRKVALAAGRLRALGKVEDQATTRAVLP